MASSIESDGTRPTRKLDGLLRAPEAARRLGVTTAELLRLVHSHQVRHVLIEDVVHVSESAIEEFVKRTRASRP